MASQQELYLHDEFTHNEVPFAPFASRRSVVYGTKGMIACSQPLAAEAGLEILRKGGNAADAGEAFGFRFRSSIQLTHSLEHSCRRISWIERNGTRKLVRFPTNLVISLFSS